MSLLKSTRGQLLNINSKNPRVLSNQEKSKLDSNCGWNLAQNSSGHVDQVQVRKPCTWELKASPNR